MPAVAGKNRYYPAISPDTSFPVMIFNESTCPSGSNYDMSCDADSDPSAKMWATPLPPAATKLVELAAADAPGVADKGTTNLTNSFPKWAPFTFALDEQHTLLWLTVSSIRQYGLRPPPSNSSSESASGTLIWMVGFDPQALSNGMDPSFAAFCPAVPGHHHVESHRAVDARGGRDRSLASCRASLRLRRRRSILLASTTRTGGTMKTSLRTLALAAILLAPSTAVFAAAPKTYQVTGPIVEVTPDTITVMKGKEKWEIARDKDTKVTGELKVGAKVTIMYRMTAASVEAKDDGKKAAEGRRRPRRSRAGSPRGSSKIFDTS